MNILIFLKNDTHKIIYGAPEPISKLGLKESPVIVLAFQGPVYNCGLGGSLLICKLAFLKELPIVSMPTW